MCRLRCALAVSVFIAACSLFNSAACAQKYGGILTSVASSGPPSLSIHEETTIFTTWPMISVYNNLVLYDPFKRLETPDTIIPELAESWAWSENNTHLTFTLRPGVLWHDGKPLTAIDVKNTFDTVRGASKERLRTSPRKMWYFNVQEIVTSGDRRVTFRLKRPQPSILSMLATGNSPIFPAHLSFKEQRTKPVGTGPFVFKSYSPDQHVIHEKNTNYWMKGRPYLDGVRHLIILRRPAQIAALVTGEADIDAPTLTTKPFMEQLKGAHAALTFSPTVRTSMANVLLNTRRKPWNDARMRQVVSLGLDRDAMIRSVFQGGAQRGGVNLPPPDGAYGLPEEMLRELPGYGDPEKNREQARAIMRSLGYSEANRLRVIVSARNSPNYTDPATFTVAALKDVFMDAEMQILESGTWFSTLARRDFDLAVNSTGIATDDPDVNLYENFSCGSIRNYSDYCNPEVDRLIDVQSQEFNAAKRREIVWEIDRRLMTDVARIIYGFRANYNAMRPYVKDLVAHPNQYNYGRMQDVWLDK